ncbi:MAG: ABC transporter ATP-binding protein [Verrucomicrobiia bacterium]
MFQRIDPSYQQPVKNQQGIPETSKLKQIEEFVIKKIDPWLPLMGRPLDAKQIIGGLLLLPLLVATSRYLGYLSTYCTNWVSERANADLRISVLRKLNTLSLEFFNKSTTGDLLTRIQTDTAAFHRFMSQGLNDLIKEPLTIIVVLAAMFAVEWKLTILTIVFLPICFAPLIIIGRKVRKITQKYIQVGINQWSHLVELLSSIRVIKAFGLEEEQNQRYKDSTKMQVHYAMKTVQAKELINPIIETISMLGLGVLIIFVFITNTKIPNLVGFLTGVVLLFTPIKKLANVHVMFKQASVSVDRLFDLFAEESTVKEATNPKSVTSFEKEISFENVSFSYTNQYVLDNISIKIPKGLRLGIAGESGSGKSTLVNLLFRFYDPVRGRIKIDGIDIREIRTDDLRKLMALVSQEIIVFDATVAENIACGKSGATRQEIEEAAKKANAHDFIINLPQGYDTRLGERGVTLSGGQRQRICIARAFIRNAPILVLDEATASLDSKSEAEVQAAIDALEENRTVICVAHRISTLANMDKIIVLDKGKIIEQGTFEELLKQDGVFAAMARKQGIFSESGTYIKNAINQ